jgi:CarD family transcriptional regulator
MYQAGTWVMYGVHGVCRVIGTEKQMVNRKRATFLVLEPLTQSESRFYLPTENPTAMAKLKTVLSANELNELLHCEEVRMNVWIQEENRRKQHYRELMGSGDRLALLQMIHSLYRYKEEQLEAGRKFHQSDDNFLRDAEKLMASEISLVLELSAEEARTYLRTQLKGA